MPRFVVLEHRWNGTHWDFMLESESTLKTWALETPPDSTPPVSAKQSADHRSHYLDYEGEVSGNRGTVKQWDRGNFEWLHHEDDEVRARLNGDKLRGVVSLRKIAEGSWSFTLE